MDQSRNQLSDSLSVEQVMELAAAVVRRYAARGIIPAKDTEDVVSSMMEKFLLKSDRIMEGFNAKAQLTTYLTAVFNRMCCEVIRSESRHWYALTDSDAAVVADAGYRHADIDTVIGSEVNHLRQLLNDRGREGVKLALMIRFFHGLPVSANCAREWAGSYADEVCRLLALNQQGCSKGELFGILAQAVNLVESKRVKGDAVRMWFHKQVDNLVDNMNRENSVHHNRETLVMLFERLVPAGDDAVSCFN
ncbi:MAG: hypothetical protein PHU33_17540 [Bacteroidales bacterium]|nr:hypothetical protein [Bacteroidales bacterium]